MMKFIQSYGFDYTPDSFAGVTPYSFASKRYEEYFPFEVCTMTTFQSNILPLIVNPFFQPVGAGMRTATPTHAMGGGSGGFDELHFWRLTSSVMSFMGLSPRPVGMSAT